MGGELGSLKIFDRQNGMLNEKEEEEEEKKKDEKCASRGFVYGKRLFDSIFQSPEGVLVKRSEDRYLSPSNSNSSSVFFDALLAMEVMDLFGLLFSGLIGW